MFSAAFYGRILFRVTQKAHTKQLDDALLSHPEFCEGLITVFGALDKDDLAFSENMLCYLRVVCCFFLDINADFSIRNGTDRKLAVVGDIEKDIIVIRKIRLSVLRKTCDSCSSTCLAMDKAISLTWTIRSISLPTPLMKC